MLLTLCWRASHSGLAGLQDLADRYGKPLIVLNLVKGAEKRPRESILQSEFANAISYINKGVRIQFHPGWRSTVAAQLFWRISCSRVRSAGWEVTCRTATSAGDVATLTSSSRRRQYSSKLH